MVAQALHATETRFRAVFEGAAIGIAIADLEGNVLQVNGALGRMFGLTEQALRGRNVKDWTHPDDAPQTWRLYAELVSGEREHYHLEKAFYRPDGTVLWTNLTVSLLRDADGEPQYQLALMEDTTERRLLNLRLRYEATHDALTGLPNRTFFFERLEKALAAGPGQRFGLCYLDLDGFKTVNDSLGHAAGDRLLVEVADRLQSCATAPGEMVARLGGDEFVALTTGPDTRRTVDELAGRIMNALLAPIGVDGRELTVRGSIGIVEGPAGERSAAGSAAQRRHHDVPGQGGRRQPVRARRPGGRRPRHHPARPHHGAAHRPGPGRVLHRVPAPGAPRRRQRPGRRGAGALAAPAARGAVPGPLHPARRAPTLPCTGAPVIVITTTGQIGRQVLDHVLDAMDGTTPVRVIARDPSRLARARERTEIFQGSHADPDLLAAACAGADRVFWLVPPAPGADSVEDHFRAFTLPLCEVIGRGEGVERVVAVSTAGAGSRRTRGRCPPRWPWTTGSRRPGSTTVRCVRRS
ncbi:hypothetical protein STENM223S_11874 [Streptomyces tendae]